MIKVMKKTKVCIFALIFAFLGCFSTLLFQTENVSHADSFIEVSVGGEENGCDFVMKMSATSRKGTALEEVWQEVTDSTGQQNISFLCFQWRDLQSLNFSVEKSDLFNFESNTYLGYEFLVTHMRSENLDASIGNGATRILAQNQITPSFDFNLTYFVDSTAEPGGNNAAVGNDFGLYKFNFRYTQAIENGKATKSLGDLYVAVLPDRIEDIEIPDGLQIQYTVKSSNKLLNAFNFSVDTHAFDYVNPDYLVWEVVGTDEDGKNYVLNKEMQKQQKYAGYDVIWDSDQPHTGTTFDFDSNDILGEWEVTLKIMNRDGTVKYVVPSKTVSTIKVPKKSNLWWILLCVLLIILIVVVVLLILWIVRQRKGKEKVW